MLEMLDRFRSNNHTIGGRVKNWYLVNTAKDCGVVLWGHTKQRSDQTHQNRDQSSILFSYKGQGAVRGTMLLKPLEKVSPTLSPPKNTTAPGQSDTIGRKQL